jgi:uncharacterized protein YbjQ (UPF0145 family)
MNNVLVTTTDFKEEYEVLGTAVYEYPRYMCNALTDLTENIKNLTGNMPNGVNQDGVIFLAALEELKKQAVSFNGNGLVGLNAVYAKKEVLNKSNDWVILYATIVKIK